MTSKFDAEKFYKKYIGKITCAYKSDVKLDKGKKERCYAERTKQREKYLFKGLTDDVVLIEAPKDCLPLEFETHDKKGEGKVEKSKLKEWIETVKKNAEDLGLDYCVAGHGGTSDWFYACNIQGLIENKEKECKTEIAKLLVPEEAIDFIDLSNFGDTLIPIINRPHWKFNKYKGAIHEILTGKNPDKHKNKIPEIALQRVLDNERPNFPKIQIADESDINSIPLTNVINTVGLKKKGQEYQGANVWHGSSTGMNFCLNPSKNVWHCFRCGCGGGVAKAIALNKGIIRSCDEDLSPDQFKQVLQIAREEHGLKSPKPKQSQKSISGNFIFDESDVVRPTIFSCHKIGNEFGYGFLLPKEIPIYSGKGDGRKVVGKQQIRSPVVITSERNLIEPTGETENKFKIKYTAIPNDLELRIDLKTIKDYLDNKTQIPKGEQIFNSIKKTYEKFLFFHNPLWYDVHALWDMGTYFFQLFNTYPLIELRGLSGTAKSKIMNVSRLFTLNPTSIMVNPSEASLFRVTHTKRPTKYIDEAEKLFQFIGGNWQSSPVVELINGSYTKGSAVPRLEKIGNDFRVVYYQCYSPTMVGSINGLRDATETRAITHITTKAPDKDKRGELEVEDFINDLEFAEIRNKLYLYALGSFEGIENYYRTLKLDNLKKRDFQLWKPLLAIAKSINEDLFSRVLEFAEKLSEQKKQDFIPEGSMDYKIIEVLRFFLNSGQTKIYVQAITDKLNEVQERKTNSRSVSAHLDKLGFKDFRERDRFGSNLQINKEIYEIIISPICPSLPTQPTQPTHLHINSNKNDDEEVKVGDGCEKNGVTVVKVGDANVGYIEVGNDETPTKNKKNCVLCGSPDAFIVNDGNLYCKECAYK